MGLQWATLGNHEFDLGEPVLHARLKEAAFKVVISNVTDAEGRPLADTVPNAIVPVRVSGRTLRIGLIGIMLDSAKRPWIRYLPAVDAAKAQVAALKGRTDAIVALTHLTLLDDRALVEAVPEIDLVLGGHEHENVIVRRGRRFTPIVKADSNALTAPRRVMVTTPVELDGRSTIIRSGPSLLADIVLAGLRREAAPVDVTLLNIGTVRIDDVLPPGPLTEYDVIRILPYTDLVMKMSMEGSLLVRVLQAGAANAPGGTMGAASGNGGYLRALGAAASPEGWTVNGRAIDPTARYSVAMPDYLLSGQDTGFPFLTAANTQIHDVQTLRDMRVGFIEELKARYGASR